ncbi:hypothetical protein ACFQJ5_12665 [Halomicroarcula sp. GCM10025324]|uniref:hypothetical protein n=1 Tax=Haloarcula TaxID=2237 RepID=UPI0023E7BA78|nr:hypothetical protein [Halomicroarcula sp. ZS-22-S1]
MLPLPVLQVPGAAELVIVLFIFLIGLVLLVGASYWVYSDAKKRGNDNALIWGLGTAFGFFLGLFPGLLVVGIYFVTRD